MTIETSRGTGVPPGSPEGGETVLTDILTKITRTGRKPNPGEVVVMIIRGGNISVSGHCTGLSSAHISGTFLTGAH